MKPLLAWRMYPEPADKDYYAEDLDTEKKVEYLFDYCQILQATIFDEGWKFLLRHYGIEKLFEINNESGWHDAVDVADFRTYLPAHLFDE